MPGEIIRAQLQWMNIKYYLENMMPGKYCVRERMYVDVDFDCGLCTVCKGEK